MWLLRLSAIEKAIIDGSEIIFPGYSKRLRLNSILKDWHNNNHEMSLLLAQVLETNTQLIKQRDSLLDRISQDAPEWVNEWVKGVLEAKPEEEHVLHIEQ